MNLRRSRHRALFSLATAAFVLLTLFPSGGIAQDTAPSPNPTEQIETLLNGLTPEERVGQLFLVTFQGDQIQPEIPIYDLIHNHHIGGVVLLARNDNIIPINNDPQTIPQQVKGLISDLQQVEWGASVQTQINPSSGLTYLPNFIPLFVAVPQEGDGYPYDQILLGTTELPNQMAIGGTWKTTLATQVGSIMGKELSAMGINLLIGPSLDVLDLPQIEISNNLGTRTFGGDPYWVAEMGRAYIRGVHQGSEGRLAVAAKHFPGHGGSDRLPEDEVATVRKSLDELKSIDLAPFLSVSGNALTAEDTSDALLTSHIRYQGLQGNIRTTTRPVSLDPQALGLLMELPGLSNWRKNGGILISDDLGNMAIRRFYELTNQAFDPRRVALNAFLAGNDILFIADFSTSNNPDSYTEALRTIDFFAQKYREDSAFAQRVDDSVRRILQLKYRLYPSFSLEDVEPNSDALGEINTSSSTTFDVARSSATLLSPSQAELDTTIPDPPNQNDRIVFISDSQIAQQCSKCNPFPTISQTALQDAVIKLYGPQAGGLISVNNLASYSFLNLEGMLNTSSDQTDLERDLTNAHWIIFVVSIETGVNSSFETLKRFLAERPDLFQQKRLIVFSMTAPYFLDATNISKLTAYYTVYSKVSAFIDTAAYLLFGELRATGASPVSVPGIGYNLNDALFPNSELVIPLEFDFPNPQQPITSTVTPEPNPPPEFFIGDVIPLRAGPIYDFNGNPVPDGTPVSFVFSYGGETTSIRQVAYSQKGVARTTYTVPSPGTLEIVAESENARSDTILLDIPSPVGEEGNTPSATLEPTPTSTTVPPTPTFTPTPIENAVVEEPDQPGLATWILSVLVSFGLAIGIYLLSVQVVNLQWGLRVGFLSFIGGMLAYIILVTNFANNQELSEMSLPWSVIMASLAGVILGVTVTLVWRFISTMTKRGKTF